MLPRSFATIIFLVLFTFQGIHSVPITGNTSTDGSEGNSRQDNGTESEEDDGKSASEEIYEINTSNTNSREGDVFDQVLTEEQKRLYENSDADTGPNTRRKRSIRNKPVWPNGIIPYSFEDEYNRQQRDKIRKAMEIIEGVSCVKFVPRSNHKGYVHIYDGGVCSSNVGYRGTQQFLSLAPKCLTEGVMVHEMLHTLGFYHEQSRVDREKYIQIIWSRVRANKEHNFNKRTEDEVIVGSLGSTYDYKSIMHYGSNFWSNNGLPTIVNINNPSDTKFGGKKMTKEDIMQLRRLYRCDNPTATAPEPTTTTTTTPEPTTTTTTTTPEPITTTTTTATTPEPTTSTTSTTTTPEPTTTYTTTNPPSKRIYLGTKLIVSPNDECLDASSLCNYVDQYQHDVCWHEYFKRNCRRSCGLCTAEQVLSSTATKYVFTTTTTAAPTTEPVTTTTTAQECKDSTFRMCIYVSNHPDKFCSQAWAKQSCRASCGIC